MPPARGGRVQAPSVPDTGATLRPTRSNLPYLIAAAGGILLFIALFLSWISVGGATASGWEVFSIVDVVLALLAAISAAIGVSIVTGTELPVPGLRPELLKWVGGGAAGAAEASQSSGPPAGWYPDPQGQARLRYWDGDAWTDQTSA